MVVGRDEDHVVTGLGRDDVGGQAAEVVVGDARRGLEAGFHAGHVGLADVHHVGGVGPGTGDVVPALIDHEAAAEHEGAELGGVGARGDLVAGEVGDVVHREGVLLVARLAGGGQAHFAVAQHVHLGDADAARDGVVGGRAQRTRGHALVEGHDHRVEAGRADGLGELRRDGIGRDGDGGHTAGRLLGAIGEHRVELGGTRGREDRRGQLGVGGAVDGLVVLEPLEGGHRGDLGRIGGQVVGRGAQTEGAELGRAVLQHGAVFRLDAEGRGVRGHGADHRGVEDGHFVIGGGRGGSLGPTHRQRITAATFLDDGFDVVALVGGQLHRQRGVRANLLRVQIGGDRSAVGRGPALEAVPFGLDGDELLVGRAVIGRQVQGAIVVAGHVEDVLAGGRGGDQAGQHQTVVLDVGIGGLGAAHLGDVVGPVGGVRVADVVGDVAPVVVETGQVPEASHHDAGGIHVGGLGHSGHQRRRAHDAQEHPGEVLCFHWGWFLSQDDPADVRRELHTEQRPSRGLDTRRRTAGLGRHWVRRKT